MATRFYVGQRNGTVPSTGAAIPFNTNLGVWFNATSNPFNRFWLQTTKRNIHASGTTFFNVETQGGQVCISIAQFLSPPLAAQSITGTFRGYFVVTENNTGADMKSAIEVRVMSSDGQTVRGTPYAADLTNTLSSEWSTTTTSRRFPWAAAGNTLTSVNAQDGDYLVIDIGWRTTNTSITSFTGTMYINDVSGFSDLPENETNTNTSLAPWIEFSHNFTFLGAANRGTSPLDPSRYETVGLPQVKQSPDLVIPNPTIAASNVPSRLSYSINRVYDNVAGKFVRWVTGGFADTTGTRYPGPGVFGIDTNDYVVESKYTA